MSKLLLKNFKNQNYQKTTFPDKFWSEILFGIPNVLDQVLEKLDINYGDVPFFLVSHNNFRNLCLRATENRGTKYEFGTVDHYEGVNKIAVGRTLTVFCFVNEGAVFVPVFDLRDDEIFVKINKKVDNDTANIGLKKKEIVVYL